jgi:pimeloyl-ACP methyl ester carboxylesterase
MSAKSKLFIGIIILTLTLPSQIISQENTFSGETIEFKSLDDLEITADLYLTDDLNAPFILLFHQAGWSRGSYREIAPQLNALGFNCMAIDQRSGNFVNDITNETAARAKIKGLAMKYPDAYQDMQAALNYVYEKYEPKVMLIWGSSYSAALSFILADKNMEMLDGMLAFSPGEYFTFEGKSISEYAENLHMPVFITSSKDEEKNWSNIYEAIPSKYKMNFVPDFDGYHGSRSLWRAHEGNEQYWEHVKEFLKLFK